MSSASPARTAGIVSREVTLNGVTYTLSNPDRVRKAADEEALVIARRLDMLPTLARACQSLPESERAAWRRDYITTMIAGIASPEEWSNYYNSMWQIAFRFWNALDAQHKVGPDKKPMGLVDGVEWAYETLMADGIKKADVDSLQLAISIVSQEAALGE